MIVADVRRKPWPVNYSMSGRSVNFSQSFNTLGHDLYTSIASMNCDYIKQLNINYMYWISVDVLKNILSQLKNLEVLYAVGTELKMSSRDINQYVRLKKLAISLSEDDFDNRCVETIKNLTALSRIPHLEELWICDEDITFQAIPYCAIAKSKNLKKLVIQSKVPIESDIDKHINQQNIKIFENKRNGGGVEMVFGVISRKTGDMTKSQHLESQLEEYFKVFETLRDMPYGPKDKKIIDITGSMETIYFEELNFCYPVILCKSKYMMAAINILSSRSARELKKLKVRSCLFGMPEDLFPSQIPNPLQTEGKSPTKLNHPFWTLAQNLRVLKELEIEACPDCNGATVRKQNHYIRQTAGQVKGAQKITEDISEM
ncbi:hypothetical protein NQ317_019896 [Molorchus minor]|uniref:Uncharacterized protein n=1 Tax=Molorchus minor TaxID=1323400 RepID=A0ABQ9J835_9CUCU|nr:hypothetical protein NQ317_019896 [Molorchus minor]